MSEDFSDLRNGVSFEIPDATAIGVPEGLVSDNSLDNQSTF